MVDENIWTPPKAIRSGKARLFFQKGVLSGRLNIDGFEKKSLTWRFCSATKVLSSFDQCFIQGLSKAKPH